jgi:hypothetical protein
MPNLENAANAFASQPTNEQWQGAPSVTLRGGDENCATLHNMHASEVADIENEHDLGVERGSLDVQGPPRLR